MFQGMITAASAQPAAPAGGVARRRGSTFGHDVGHAPVRELVGGHVPQPLREEAGHVHVEGGGAREDLGVARPAQALVALRAVGGHVEEVALLAPDDVVLELVDERASRSRTRSPAPCRSGRRRRSGASGVSSPGIAVHRHVAEAEEGEVRLEGLRAAALQRVAAPSPSPCAGSPCRSCPPCRAPRRGAA